MENLNGYICHGIFKGFAEKQSRPNAQGVVRTTLECAVEVKATTDFGEVPEIRIFKVPENIIQMGIPPRMANLIGKHINLPFVTRDWEMNGRKGTSIQLCQSIKKLLDTNSVLIKQQDKAA